MIPKPLYIIGGTLGADRTRDTQLRRLVLYPLSYERTMQRRLINLVSQVKTSWY